MNEALTELGGYITDALPKEVQGVLIEHDELMVVGISQDQVSPEDRARLDELGFLWNEDEEYWFSFRYGSA